MRDVNLKKVFWLEMSLLLLSFCTAPRYAPTIRFPYLWLGVQGFGGDIDRQQFREPYLLSEEFLASTGYKILQFKSVFNVLTEIGGI